MIPSSPIEFPPIDPTASLVGTRSGPSLVAAPPRSSRAKRIAVLGSTGSIGRSTCDVITASQGELQALALCAHRSVELLEQQAHALRPRMIAITDASAARHPALAYLPQEVELLVGPEALIDIATHPDVDMVVSAIVGSVGLRATWAALEAGKSVALANKETLVVGGSLIMQLAQERKAALLPVDSEHSAVFQAMQAGRRDEVRRIILTASGGPFRHLSLAQLPGVTIRDALAHPTWQMGPKISIDSATMMNKALEIIEARWLFDLTSDQIEVAIHPQSIVHSLVEFVDGSVLAQLSPPDMKLPIQYALYWPQRRSGPAAKFDWRQTHRLEFEPPDLDRFDALRLGFEVATAGGTAGAVLNGANEAAVAAFLNGAIGFHQIVPACRAVLEHHTFDPRPSLSQLERLDAWARAELQRWAK